MSVQSVLQALHRKPWQGTLRSEKLRSGTLTYDGKSWTRKPWIISSLTLLLVPILLTSGCALPAPAGNNSETTNQTAAGTSRSSASPSPSNTTNAPSHSSTQSGQTNQTGTSLGAPLQLENIQIGDKSVLFTTTHGNMRQAFVDPHIENGNPNRFVVTLAQTTPGKYAVNKTTRLQTHWATSMTIVQHGQDLEVQFELLPTIQRFTSAMGAGQMVLYTFQST